MRPGTPRARSIVLNAPSSRGNAGDGRGTGAATVARGGRMIGICGRSLFIVPAVAIFLAGPASAQVYGNQGVYSEPLPPPTGQARYEDLDSRRPTSAIPQDSRSGHYYPSSTGAVLGPESYRAGQQFDSRSLPPVGSAERDVVRPPGSVGAMPVPQPVATQPAAVQAPAAAASAD